MDLVIKQHIDRTETVSSSLIDVLYQLTKPDSSTGQSLANAVLVGRLQTPAAYEDAVNFLNDKFSSEQDNGSDFQVTVLNNNYYIRFADPEVVRVLTARGIIEEGGGLTITQARNVDLGADWFLNNSLIETFNESNYFSGIIQSNCFQWCSGLTSINLTNVTTMGINAFRGCVNLEKFNGDDSEIGVLRLPNLVSWSNYQFDGCRKLEKVVSLGTVTSLPVRAFYNCSSLTEIILPQSCVSLLQQCCSGCISLTAINITQIQNFGTGGGNQFNNCPNLEYFNGPESTRGELHLPNVTGILKASAFAGCTKLTSVTSLGSIAEIEYRAFENCSNLATINIPNSVSVIGDNAFTGTAWYDNTAINPNDAPIIVGNGVLYKYKGQVVGNYSIPSGVKYISKFAFQNNVGLTGVIFPASLNDLAQEVFDGCTALTSITVDGNNQTLDSRNNCNAVIKTATDELILGCEGTIIPNTVKKLADLSFKGIATNKTIPDSVTSIGTAFRQSGISSIIVPNGVTSIVMEAFSGCTSLVYIDLGTGITNLGRQIGLRYCTTFICRAITPPHCDHADTFYLFNSGGNAYIYVPDASIDAYKTANIWKTWESRIKPLSELPNV